MLNDVAAAYRAGRRDAQATSTVRLRMIERRLRRRLDQLAQTERAYLSGVRDELRDRGLDLPEISP